MGRWDPRSLDRTPGRPEDPDQLEADVDQLPFDDTDPEYLQLRRDAQDAHYRDQIDLARRRADTAAAEPEQQRAASDLRAWTRLLDELHRADHFTTGAGDRTLF